MAAHAAFYLLQHLPQARYADHDGLAHRPTGVGIRVIAKNWARAANDSKPLTAPTMPQPGRTSAKPLPIPADENARLWAIRNAAAQRYDAQYNELGCAAPPPHPSDHKDVDQLAVMEGWHDFAARYPALRGTLYVDHRTGIDRADQRAANLGLGPAVPPEYGADPSHAGKTKSAIREAKAILRHDRISSSFRDLAFARLVADLTSDNVNDYDLHRKIWTRLRPTHQLPRPSGPEAERDFTNAIRVRLAWLTNAAYCQRRQQAEATVKVANRLNRAYAKWAENRHLWHDRPNRDARAADAQLYPKLVQALRALAQHAAQSADSDTTPELRQLWQDAATATTNLCHDADRHHLPETLSPYETDRYAAILASTPAELRRSAIEWFVHYPNRYTKQTQAVLEPDWIVTWQGYDHEAPLIGALRPGDVPQTPAEKIHLVFTDTPDQSNYPALSEVAVAQLDPERRAIHLKKLANAVACELDPDWRANSDSAADPIRVAFCDAAAHPDAYFGPATLVKLIEGLTSAYAAYRADPRNPAAVPHLLNLLDLKTRRNSGYPGGLQESLRAWLSCYPEDISAACAELPLRRRRAAATNVRPTNPKPQPAAMPLW